MQLKKKTITNKTFWQQTNIVRCVSFQLRQTESTSTSLPRSETDSSFLSSISIIHIDPCIPRAQRPLCSLPHAKRVYLFRPLLQWLEEREKKKKKKPTQHNRANWYNIHLLRVCLCFIMSRWGDRGARRGKKRQRKRVAFKWRNVGGGGMRWGRWDFRMTLLVGDLYPLVEWPSSHGKIYRISPRVA